MDKEFKPATRPHSYIDVLERVSDGVHVSIVHHGDTAKGVRMKASDTGHDASKRDGPHPKSRDRRRR